MKCEYIHALRVKECMLQEKSRLERCGINLGWWRRGKEKGCEWVVSLEACAQEGNMLKYNSTMH